MMIDYVDQIQLVILYLTWWLSTWVVGEFIMADYVFLIAAVQCANISGEYAHATINTTDTSYLTYVQISCDYGYDFPNESVTVTTQCMADKSWSVWPSQCQRK